MVNVLGNLFVIASILMLNPLPAISQVKFKVQTKIILSRQNNPGHPANNFSYILADGRKGQLYTLDAKYTLLYFYNPECDACNQYRDLLGKSKAMNDCLKKDILKVLSIYIDKDTRVWKKHLPEMPGRWIQGRDDNEYLYKNNVYDLHAIPTIYLLDRNKKVILKDVLDLRLIEKALK
ncbi:MAG: hypothetical protein EOO85_22350 [Pedobacter sp.]|nr:MAG: hypothetical protein EOO85_22350 [Pedobacter sp.]